jgi:hypothetical protein
MAHKRWKATLKFDLGTERRDVLLQPIGSSSMVEDPHAARALGVSLREVAAFGPEGESGLGSRSPPGNRLGEAHLPSSQICYGRAEVPVLELIIASWISLAPPAEGPAPEADLTEARRLFDEGLARYEAADYEGAIEVFTLALGEVRGQGGNNFTVRGLLLFNIGRAHMRAYDIDHDVEHLRQAQTIFERFVEEAESRPGEIDEADISEAREQLAELERMLSAAEQSERDRDADRPTGDPKKLRARGIGLTAAGVALLGGGIGMLAFGSGFGAAAEAQVAPLDTLGLPPDSPAFDDADDFVAAERRKGAGLMAAGGVTAALGVVGVTIGIQQLVKAKRVSNKPAISTAASFSRDGVWFAITGRF